MPLLWIAVAFALLGVLVAGRKGALALLGVVASAALVTTFLVPAILNGRSPVLASLVAALAVMFITLALTYGVTHPASRRRRASPPACSSRRSPGTSRCT